MELKRYQRRGYFLFPISKQTKSPIIKDNLERATLDGHQLKQWKSNFPECNWGLSLAKSGLVCVDVDEKGLSAWYDLIFDHGEPETLTQKSGSGHGFHYVFRAEEGLSYRGKIKDGIDVKHNGYIVVAPSVHPRTGLKYQWVDFEKAPAEMPQWLKDLTVKPETKASVESPTRDKLDREFYSVAEFLKVTPFGYQEWFNIGAALHAASEGSKEGLALFLSITSGVNFKEGDLEAARSKWQGFTPKGGIGPGTYFNTARALGYTGAAWDFTTPLEWTKTKSGLQVASDIRGVIEHINAKGYAMLRGTYEGQLIKHWLSVNGVKHFKMISSEHIKNSLKDMCVQGFSSGKPVKRPALEVWLESSYKATFNGVVFKPEPEEGALNLWSGIPCSPKRGDVGLFLELIYVLCGEDTAKKDYFIKWLGHLFQKPDVKPVIVPVFIGEQGAGKGLFFDGVIAKILTTDFYSRLDKPGVIKERFNAEQARKFLTVLDEASWRGDHELNGVLKSLTGSPTMTIEEKFGGRYTIENYSRYVILSNEIDAVRIESTNRRYLVFNTSSRWKGTDNFSKVAELVKTQDAHQWLYEYLLNVDVSDFDPYTFPEHLDKNTEASKLSSLSPAGKFWLETFLYSPDELWDGRGLLLIKAAWQKFKTDSEPGKFYKLTDFVNDTELVAPFLRDKKKGKGWEIAPHEFMEGFFKYNRLTPPEEFDDLSFIGC